MAKTHSAQPNVVVFFTDQQRWDTTGVHGNPLDSAPNCDHTAQEGTHLVQGFTLQPVSDPVRAAPQERLVRRMVADVSPAEKIEAEASCSSGQRLVPAEVIHA